MAQPNEKLPVSVIPASVSGEETEGADQKKEKLRVAAYCRVSTGDESQKTSYTKQKEFYTGYIKNKEGWSCAGIYADEAASGTSRMKRVQFNQMMEDAMHEKIDYIVTKSISRFARNTLDTLDCVRQLAALQPPVGIFFEKENIDTLDEKSELVLTILSALAQDESRSISENIRWTFQKKFQEGKPQVNLSRMTGYEKGSNGEWVIQPEQAEIVRFIFQEFLAGQSGTQIAAALNAMGKTTVNGKSWRTSGVYTILRNEKYVGDLEMQKYITKDFLAHRTKRNEGEAPRYYVKNHHIGIVDRSTWETAQKILKAQRRQRGTLASEKSNSLAASPFVNLVCGACGAPMGRYRYSSRAGGYQDARCIALENERRLEAKKPLLDPENYMEWYSFGYAVLRCSAKYGSRDKSGRLSGAERDAYEKNCPSHILYETALEQGFMELMYQLKLAYEKEGGSCALIQDFQTLCAEAYKKNGASCGADIWKQNLSLFLNCLKELPVNTPQGDALHIYGLHQGTPDFLKFEKGMYLAFIIEGTVDGDDVLLRTNFGLTLTAHTHGRSLSSFVGYRYFLPDQGEAFFSHTHQVNGRSVQYHRRRKRERKQQKR